MPILSGHASVCVKYLPDTDSDTDADANRDSFALSAAAVAVLIDALQQRQLCNRRSPLKAPQSALQAFLKVGQVGGVSLGVFCLFWRPNTSTIDYSGRIRKRLRYKFQRTI